MRKILPLGALFASLAVASCDHKKCQDPEPQPRCVAGQIIGSRCMDGLLIEVDARYPIGKPAFDMSYDSIKGNNIIAAVNAADFPGLAVGQRIYFTYHNDPQRQMPNWTCFAYDGLKTAVPHLVLSNVSATGCENAQ